MEIPVNNKTDDSEPGNIQEKLSTIEERIAALEAENRKLREAIMTLQAQRPGTEGSGEFTEASGVLWKRNRSGGYESVPYCPTCKSTLADYSGSLLCLKCNWQAPLKSFEAPRIHHDLMGGGM